MHFGKTSMAFLDLDLDLAGCDDLRGFPSVDHAIFTNVSGPACDSGLWDGTVDGDGQIFKQVRQ